MSRHTKRRMARSFLRVHWRSAGTPIRPRDVTRALLDNRMPIIMEGERVVILPPGFVVVRDEPVMFDPRTGKPLYAPEDQT